MYAIVEIAGQQFKVSKDQKVFVHRLKEEQGAKVSFDKVLLLDNEGAVTIGAPAIDGASVEAKVLSHLKGDKVIVFKKKRRKGYRVKNGHRQSFTQIQIEGITASGAKKATKKEVVKPEAKKAAPKKAVSTSDDLKKIEGVGPKISELLVNAGLDTFAKVAASTPEAIKEILVAGGSRFASKNPGSWPKQAKWAANGEWETLEKWQDEVKGGIE